MDSTKSKVLHTWSSRWQRNVNFPLHFALAIKARVVERRGLSSTLRQALQQGKATLNRFLSGDGVDMTEGNQSSLVPKNTGMLVASVHEQQLRNVNIVITDCEETHGATQRRLPATPKTRTKP